MKKQIWTALAAAIFIGGLTACGNDNAADPSSNALPGGFSEATSVPQGGETNIIFDLGTLHIGSSAVAGFNSKNKTEDWPAIDEGYYDAPFSL